MGAGRISIAGMATIKGLTLHAFSINNEGGLAHFFQGPDNVWQVGNTPANPPTGNTQPSAFVSVKAVNAIPAGVAFALCTLDSNGLLWFATADANVQTWGSAWQALGAGQGATGTNFSSFDIVSDAYLGLILVAISSAIQPGWTTNIPNGGTVFNGLADFRIFSTANQTSWTIGWPAPAPNQRFPYGFGAPFGGSATPYPPIISNVSIAENNGGPQNIAPIVSGVMAGVVMSLYVDPNSGNWEWSAVPTVPTTNPPIATAPYPFLKSVFLTSLTPFPTILIDENGNIYQNVAGDAIGSTWTYQGVINPPGMPQIAFAKVVSTNTYPLDANGNPANTLIALGRQTGAVESQPFLMTAPANTLNWTWQGPLPGLPARTIPRPPRRAPPPNCIDFDVAVRGDTQNVQVVLLGGDGNVYINFQNAQGGWAIYAGAKGGGLP